MLKNEAGVDSLSAELVRKEVEGNSYWICAFCVDQHVSICRNCNCGKTKWKNGDTDCEMDKFDAMMKMSKEERAGDFEQVIAVDRKFELFDRAWCVAELAEADRSRMRQRLKVLSLENLEDNYDEIEVLDVRNCGASREEDKA